jgi:hypothetical protein
MRRVPPTIALLLVWLAMPTAAHADPILFASFSGQGAGDGITLNAQAIFEISGTTLKITLRNTGDTSGSDFDKSANTLTGVFFDLPTGITLTPVKAKITEGDLLQPEKCLPSPCSATLKNVGGEFVYQTGTWSGHLGNSGISSSGYINADNGGGNFNGPNLDDPDAPDGINFGIVAPLSQSPFKPKSGNMADNPLIEGEVVFTMSIAGGTLLESQISNVSFQYGTSIGEPKFNSGPPDIELPPPGVPEPALLLLLAPAAAAGFRRRRAQARDRRE